MNDSKLIEELNSALDEQAASVRSTPDAAQRARARARRRRTVRGLVAGVPAVALAAGLVVAAQGRPAPATSATSANRATSTARPAGTTAASPRYVTAAYVTRQVEAALANADHFIIRDETGSYPGGTLTEWTDPRTGSTYSVQGTGAQRTLAWNSTFYVKKVLHWKTVEADYSSHTWFVSIIHAAGPIQGAPPSGPDVPGGSPAQLQEMLKKGLLHIAGHGTVNGHKATELKGNTGPVTLTVWVDSTTYQPVRYIRDFGKNLGSLVFNETWMPRSPALVHIANTPRIPAGFTRVPAPK